MGTFPRKVVISPGFGAGIATWMYGERPDEERWLPYERVEHPEFVAYVEACLAVGERPDPDTVRDIWVRAGLLGEDEHVFLNGLRDVTVVEVTGPYRIAEYDGSESIEYAIDPWWRH